MPEDEAPGLCGSLMMIQFPSNALQTLLAPVSKSAMDKKSKHLEATVTGPRRGNPMDLVTSSSSNSTAYMQGPNDTAFTINTRITQLPVLPAPPNYPLRHPENHPIQTIRPLIEVHGGGGVKNSRFKSLPF